MLSEQQTQTLEQLSAAEKDAADLTGVQWPFFGYAPGFYMGTCQDCKAIMVGCAKRSTSCFACAIKAASAPRTGQLVEVQADDATVERVARVVADYQIGVGLPPEDAWEDANGIAHAVIAAMKGPKL